MILNRLRVQHFRCFRNPVELSGMGLGVHVIHAPNESGKSSLVLALARALFDRHNTKDRTIHQLRPWKTDLSPRITMEFEAGGRRYKLEKAFLDEASSLLEEWTGARFERVADSLNADERVRAFLNSGGSLSGATKLGQWGIARLLWLNQVPERQDLPALDPSLKGRLLEAMGIAALSPEEQTLIKAVDAAYCQYYTPKTGKPTVGSELTRVEERIQSLTENVTHLLQRKEDLSRNADSLADNRLRLTALQAEKDGYTKQLTDLQERIQEEERKEQELLLIRKDAERQRQRAQSLDEQQRALLELQDKATKQETVAAQRQPLLLKAREVFHVVEGAWKEARQKLKAQRDAFEKVEQRLERGRLLEKALGLQEKQHHLEGLIKQGERLEAALKNSMRKLPAGGLSDAAVKRAEELERKLLLARSRLEAQGTEVCFTAETARTLEWEEQGATHEYKLAKAEQQRFMGVTSGELRIKGVGTLSVRTGADEVCKLQAEVDKLRKELARRLHEQGVRDLPGLKTAWEEQRAQIEEQKQRQGALQAFLEAASVESLDALREQLRELAGELGTVAEQLSLSLEQLSAQKSPETESLSEELKRARREVKLQEKAHEEAEARVREAEQHQRTIALEQERALQAVGTLKQTLQSQLEALGWTFEQLGAEVAKAAAEVRRHENMVKGLESGLPRPEARATTQRGKLQQALEQVQEAEKTMHARIIRAETLIEQAAAEDLYAHLCEAEEALELEQKRKHQAQLKAEAARVLRTLTIAWQEQVSRSFLGPIENAVHARLEHVRGVDAPGRLQLDANFADAQLQTGAGPKALDTFSWGTQEQIQFALRLAIGELLANRGSHPEPQLIVLDDALVNTDALRLQRALELIEAAGNTLQILILTAFPERYRTLMGAKTHDLLALAQSP
ncbi:AAA family ATPase [Corallococcus sp. AS-1-6]|uniref:AAA family ATPase n=1 Tax=Corallococcus sp. AS-1-6 TaxID=2874599 RepID=UPI001CBD58E0|nr:AAA family ATPase [Corallococcus sp. AS-1-6]MBZ4373524.1 AAA family ATPase [Corallococcus sp. AS-1-6]